MLKPALISLLLRHARLKHWLVRIALADVGATTIMVDVSAKRALDIGQNGHQCRLDRRLQRLERRRVERAAVKLLVHVHVSATDNVEQTNVRVAANLVHAVKVTGDVSVVAQNKRAVRAVEVVDGAGSEKQLECVRRLE